MGRNILFITTDQQRYDSLGCNGGKVARTPVADRLAAAGVRRVEDLGHCTYADATRFFSYRRCTHRNEPDYGRHINAIALVG